MKIEAIFGGILALFAVAFFAALLFTRGPAVSSASAASTRVAAVPAHPLDVLLDAGMSDDAKVCECLKQGRVYGARGLGPSSSEYTTGYSMCRDLAGQEASLAWSVGFESAGNRPMSCRRFRRGDILPSDPSL